MPSKILFCLGTRPSYIKLAPLYHALCAENIEPYVISTGQHAELVSMQLATLQMPIHQDLQVMQESRGLNDTMSLVIRAMDGLISEHHPELLIVVGDTTSCVAAGMAAFHRSVAVGHVEAGLRSNCLWSPYPEEWNRVSLDALSSLLFAPTLLAADQARQTNRIAKIYQTGNPVVDSVQAILATLPPLPPWTGVDPYLVLDLHRRESFGSRMLDMVTAVIRAAKAHDHRVVWPVHPNPAVRVVAETFEDEAMQTVDPMEYSGFIDLLRRSSLIVTDSGGTVEESCSLGVPTLQLREYTDRPEAVSHQFSWLVGTEPPYIEKLTGEALAMGATWRRSLTGRPNPFGDGRAGARIAGHIKEWLDG